MPLLKSLENLLKLEDYQAEVINSHQSQCNSELKDFCDGLLYKSHALFGCDSSALQLVAYYDELEVVNPIGSYVKRHKLGCMFYFLGNVRPQYRSTLKQIQLIAVGKYEDITKYGIDEFMKPFVEDVKSLYCDGINVSIGGVEKVLHGGLLAFLADNLAAHLVGGFKQSMSFALRICRGCLITQELSQDCFLEKNCELRTPDAHFNHCSLLSGPLAKHYSTSYGINRLSILEEIPEFSVTTNMPHDIMHDLFEGVVPHHMTLLLCHCVKNKYFSIQELNQRISVFDFLHNRPTEIDAKICNTDSKVKQSASQMMSFVHKFPLIIGDKVPEDDGHWQLFLILIRICSIAIAPSCTFDLAAYLEVLIEEYLSSFRLLYPSVTLIPKQHYMIHYPSQMLKYGPLIHTWTMRQESKLSFFKQASRFSNYKNVPKTVARRHQFWLCHQILTNPDMLTPQLEISPKRTSNSLLCEDDFIQAELYRMIPNLSNDSIIQHPQWVQTQASRFCKELFVLIEYDSMDPIFGKITDIATVEDSVVISVIHYFAQSFFPHFNAFIVQSKGHVSAVDINCLADHRPFYSHFNFSSDDHQLYITLPYYY